jgi:anti-anti-sigma regulatory factor
MKEDGNARNSQAKTQIHDSAEQRRNEHIVFDFTGLEQPDVCDLSLILTARLQSAPTDSVWVRSLPSQTARILRLLRLDHLFREYPTSSGEMN